MRRYATTQACCHNVGASVARAIAEWNNNENKEVMERKTPGNLLSALILRKKLEKEGHCKAVAKQEVAKTSPHQNLLSIQNKLFEALTEKVSSKTIMVLWQKLLTRAKEYKKYNEYVTLVEIDNEDLEIEEIPHDAIQLCSALEASVKAQVLATIAGSTVVPHFQIQNVKSWVLKSQETGWLRQHAGLRYLPNMVEAAAWLEIQTPENNESGNVGKVADM
ncbi:hypothetical protein C2G38_2158951 [Gigaspora rosea]|uniref:Uncharacterized protein n=1 Tax=Gigaspora rosea TaxID=44941 RepID=A0A397W9C0_9GLOM|nr:hypothetical protein C2G38_2158951 [Gigaspora rosea]